MTRITVGAASGRLIIESALSKDNTRAEVRAG